MGVSKNSCARVRNKASELPDRITAEIFTASGAGQSCHSRQRDTGVAADADLDCTRLCYREATSKASIANLCVNEGRHCRSREGITMTLRDPAVWRKRYPNSLG